MVRTHNTESIESPKKHFLQIGIDTEVCPQLYRFLCHCAFMMGYSYAFLSMYKIIEST